MCLTLCVRPTVEEKTQPPVIYDYQGERKGRQQISFSVWLCSTDIEHLCQCAHRRRFLSSFFKKAHTENNRCQWYTCESLLELGLSKSVCTSVTWTKDTDLLQTSLFSWQCPLQNGPQRHSQIYLWQRQLDETALTPSLLLTSWAWRYQEVGEDSIFTSLSFTTSVLQEGTSSPASHPNAARRALGQLINSLCRGEERGLVYTRSVCVCGLRKDSGRQVTVALWISTPLEGLVHHQLFA